MGFHPDSNNRVDGFEGLLPIHDLLFEFFDILGGHHAHEFHGMSLNEFNDFIHSTENWVLVPFFELEVLSFPNFNDNLEFGLNLGFFGSSINELLNFLGEFMELKLDKIVKAELW